MGGGTAPTQSMDLQAIVEERYTAMAGASGDMPFNLMEVLAFAGAVNPHDVASPFNPEEYVEDIDSKFSALGAAIALLNAGDYIADLTEAAILAISYTDVSTFVTAREAATEAPYQRRVSNIMSGMWLSGSYMTTQFAPAGLLAASERSKELANLSGEAFINQTGQFFNFILNASQQRHGARLAVAQAASGALSAAVSTAQMVVTLFDDYYAKRVESAMNKRMWKFQLLNDSAAIIMSVSGAQLVPRALTKAEANSAKIGTAVQTALQFGAATNPVLGALAGFGSLAIQGGASR